MQRDFERVSARSSDVTPASLQQGGTSDCQWFVASCMGKTVGAIELVHRPHEFRPFDGYWIHSVEVSPVFKGMGIATQLCRAAIAAARKSGAASLRLKVGRGNRPAINLYLKLGFQRRSPAISRQTDVSVPADSSPDLIEMEKLLEVCSEVG